MEPDTLSIPMQTAAARGPEATDITGGSSDAVAFAGLYRGHVATILGYVERRVGDRHVAEDLVADVFLAAWRALPRYRDRGLPVRSWLYRIAANRVNRWATRERPRAPARLDREPITTAAPDLLAEELRLALLDLPARLQLVLTLFYLEDLSIREIARIARCRAGTIKSRLARGRAALRRLLERRRQET